MRRITGWVWLALIFGIHSLFAQEITVEGITPVPMAKYPADTLPIIRTSPLPAYPPAWLENRQPGWATIGMVVDRDGKVQAVDVDVAQGSGLSPVLSKLARTWRFKPATLKGKPVPAACRATLLFNLSRTAADPTDSPIRIVRTACTPALPAMSEFTEALYFNTSLLVKPDGTCDVLTVTPRLPKSASPEATAAYTSPEVTAAIKAMFKGWKFEPARKQGQAVEQKLALQTWAVNDGRLDFAQPQVISQIHPEYPYSLRKSGNKGTVMIDFTVNVRGESENPTVVSSSHPDFEKPALAALLQWTFKPGTVGGRPVPTRMRVPIVFELNLPYGAEVGGADPYEIKSRSRKDQNGQFSYDEPPSPKLVIQPVYPFDDLKSGKTGTASATWIVGPSGKVVDVYISKSSSPEFGQAFAAAIYSWEFIPAKLAGKPTPTSLKQEVTFDTEERDFQLDEVGIRLLRQIKKHPSEISQLKDLDHVPKARYQVAPQFLPKSQPGETLVEFYIDENGQARFPHALSSTSDELIYPALTAVARWRFEAPLLKGKKVAAIVQIPISYHAAADSAPRQAQSDGGPK